MINVAGKLLGIVLKRKRNVWSLAHRIFLIFLPDILAGCGLTKRLTKETPSCVKRQTPKAALKNVSRPRNRFATGKQSQISLTEKQNAAKENLIQTNDIQSLFNDEFLKSTNVSHFALALVQALQHVGQSAKM